MIIQKTFDEEEQYNRISPKIKCEICGKEFEKITSTHLKTHGTTVCEYRVQFPNALLVSEGWCKKQSDINLGKHHTEATRQKMRGPRPNFTGENHPFYGKKRPEHSERIKGENHPMYGKGYLIAGEKNHWYGKHHTEETKQKQSEAKLGKNHPMYGKHPSDETRQKMSKARDGKYEGENNPNWKGGASFEPYCFLFNDDLKERVRDFFGRCCYVCGKNEEDNGQKLSVHHVNYDKMVCCNDVKPLFVPLCQSCHRKTSKDREYWEEFFTVSLNYLTDGKCFLPKSNSKNNSLNQQ